MQQNQSWAILGLQKTSLLRAFLGQHRVVPALPSGIWPFLSNLEPPKAPDSGIAFVSFAYQQRRTIPTGGAFYDYSARYGAVREEDKVTLRESIPICHPRTGAALDTNLLETLAKSLAIDHLLDLPLVVLSNGQTRRAAIMRQLLLEPEVLILDEPLTGLDIKQRPSLLEFLHGLHRRKDPWILLGLRRQDPLPDWVTHVAYAQDNNVISGHRTSDSVRPFFRADRSSTKRVPDALAPERPTKHFSPPGAAVTGNPLIQIRGLNIQYENRKILSELDWTIREGERWHLTGPNGSGKTTLLSVLTGDHPQSYTQKNLVLFGKPRRQLALSQIHSRIGICSPEIFNAFPRRSGPEGLTVRDAIGTGFESIFSFRPRTPEQERRIDEVLQKFKGALSNDFDADVHFGSLSHGEQSFVLFLRAIINEPPLLILDEVFSGMPGEMITVTKEFLRTGLKHEQSVVFVSHWDEELPWPTEVRRLVLGDNNCDHR
ncbi:P-loop containing nucleoside triphosphate hydrolase protein [Cantharellus anzutake]|uniref:P-loop containing nucleoside triphosphate hydrolase protein n=1 Tax=Cantharellus anzutake TaxID=1750568 RepID=UPI0019076A82|nr:P-loop containing nucleoside triphosphate hydrolase protein [Cantharellus anzutake]KAF8342719.1 P-loop containing nucleoside triphosphate hydrolase protein [Cantharellus anzutake]